MVSHETLFIVSQVDHRDRQLVMNLSVFVLTVNVSRLRCSAEPNEILLLTPYEADHRVRCCNTHACCHLRLMTKGKGDL